MKRHFVFLVTILCTLYLLLFSSCSQEKNRYVIGVSQCSDDEWRTQMNKEIRREALFYPGVEVDIRSANDDNRKQTEDIERFIRRKVDLIVVAPNEAEAITPVIEKAYAKESPSYWLTDGLTPTSILYVGADNYEMGRQIGHYITTRLEGKGNVVELTGLKGSTPAADRHRGLMDVLSRTPGIQIVASADAGWFQNQQNKHSTPS